MPRLSVPILCSAALVGGVAAAVAGPRSVQEATAPTSTVPRLGRDAVDMLPAALVRRDGREVVIESPPVDVPGAHGPHPGMLRLPAHRVDIPENGAFHRFRVEVVDSAGGRLPPDRVHHIILFDPDHRELFQPIVLRVLAAGKETGGISVPRLLFGMPLRRGQRLIFSSMVTNADARPLRGARVRVVLGYVPARRPWPLHDVQPWTMDVAWPLGGEGGSKAFDVPPGRSERSWEGSPAIGGTVPGVGGHVHDFAVLLQFRDVTEGRVLWEGRPVSDSAGKVLAMERGLFYRWYRLGIRLAPDHRYRLTVVYDNPTGATIADGGMGSLSGLIVPDGSWPRVDQADTLYQIDLDNILQNMKGEMGHMASGMR